MHCIKNNLHIVLLGIVPYNINFTLSGLFKDIYGPSMG